jgi:hypothetical protein
MLKDRRIAVDAGQPQPEQRWRKIPLAPALKAAQLAELVWALAAPVPEVPVLLC